MKHFGKKKNNNNWFCFFLLPGIYQLDKLLNTIPDIPCVANYDNSLENSHTNIHLFNGVHPV